jgi:hypothetical protein
MTIAGIRVPRDKKPLRKAGQKGNSIGIPRRVLIRYLQFDYEPPAQLNGAQIAVLDFKIGAISTQSRERTSTHRP